MNIVHLDLLPLTSQILFSINVPGSRFVKFALDLNSGLSPSLHVLGSSRSETNHLVLGNGGISFTGHSVWINCDVAALANYQQILDVAARNNSCSIFDEIPLEPQGCMYQISAHNGALVFISDTDTSVIIQYYE